MCWLLSGYLVYYTLDSRRRHTDWVIEAVDTRTTRQHNDHQNERRQSAVITDLLPHSTYYFKLAAHNTAGYGPLSPTVIFHTAQR